MGLIMDAERIIRSMECQSSLDMKWYYHAFRYNEDYFLNMINQGIKCNKLLGKTSCDCTHNGRYFISLSKIVVASGKENSAFDNFLSWPGFIIDNIKATKCVQVSAPTILGDTLIPIRFSSNYDEYQAFKVIDPSKFVGLRCCLLSWYRSGKREYLENLKKMILALDSQNVDLRIYDYSRRDGTSVHVVDQDGYLTGCDLLIDDLVQKEEQVLSKRQNYKSRRLVSDE